MQNKLKLSWGTNDGAWCKLFNTNFNHLSFSGVYIIWGLGKSYNDPIILRVGQATNLSERIPKYKSKKEKGIKTVYSYQEKLGTIYITWAGLQESYLDGVERYLGDFYRPLIAERFPDIAPISVNLPL